MTNINVFVSPKNFPWPAFQAIAAHPSVFLDQTEDGHLSPEEVDWSQYARAKEVKVFLFSEGGNPLGWILVKQRGQVSCEAHICFLPAGRGKVALHAARLVRDWIFGTAEFQKLILEVPACNHGARRLAHLIGAVREGCSTAAFLKHGQLWDILWYGMTKDGWLVRKRIEAHQRSDYLH